MRAFTDAGPAADADHDRMEHPDELTRRRARENRTEASRARTEEQRNEHARLRAAEDRELFAMRRTGMQMAAVAHRLEIGLDHFEVRILETEVEIEAEWLTEHWGRPSPSPPSWRAAPPTAARSRRGR